MTIFKYSADEHHYREQAAGQKAMAGVTGPSFVCGDCGRVRRTKGRKSTAVGWRCDECHQARERRRAIKAVKA